MSYSLSDLSLTRLSGVLLPVDIAVVVLSTLAIDVLLGFVLAPAAPLGLLVGAPLVFVLPGYAFVAALFPARASRVDALDASVTSRLRSRLRQRGVDATERVALSIGAGFVILPVVGLVLSVLPEGFSTFSVVGALSGFVFVAAAVAVVRRARLPAERRFSVSLRATTAAVTSGLAGATLPETTVNVALALSVVAAAGAFGYVAVAPQPTGHYSDLSVLTESSDGDLVAAGYPETLGGDAPALVVRVENREGETRTYVVVAQLQRVAADGTVTERRRIETFEPTLEPGETWTTRHRPDPSATGTDLRLTYLLYRGDPPSTPTRGNAYRDVHLWVDA
jgi:uncharacterized membrane protein